MIKILFFLILGLAFNFNSTAQNSGVATYKYVDENDKVNFFRLYFDAEKSLYVANKSSVKKTVTKIEYPASIDDTIGDSKEKIRDFFHGGAYGLHFYHYDEEGIAMYKNFKDGIIRFRAPNDVASFIISEPKMPQQNWELVDSSKKIGKFICQKATTTFRGRKYEAWYAVEIPVSNGPWKFHGLPGLILEVHSIDKYFKYTFEGLEIPLKDTSIIKAPIMGESITLKEFKKEFDKREEEWMRKQVTEMAKRGQTLTFSKSGDDVIQELDFKD